MRQAGLSIGVEAKREKGALTARMLSAKDPGALRLGVVGIEKAVAELLLAVRRRPPAEVDDAVGPSGDRLVGPECDLRFRRQVAETDVALKPGEGFHHRE